MIQLYRRFPNRVTFWAGKKNQSSCKQSRPSQCSRLCLQSFSSNSCTFEPWFRVSPMKKSQPGRIWYPKLGWCLKYLISEFLKHRLLVCFLCHFNGIVFVLWIQLYFSGGLILPGSDVSTTSLASLASRIACNELDAVALAAACTAMAKSSPVPRRIRDARKHPNLSNPLGNMDVYVGKVGHILRLHTKLFQVDFFHLSLRVEFTFSPSNCVRDWNQSSLIQCWSWSSGKIWGPDFKKASTSVKASSPAPKTRLKTWKSHRKLLGKGWKRGNNSCKPPRIQDFSALLGPSVPPPFSMCRSFSGGFHLHISPLNHWVC